MKDILFRGKRVDNDEWVYGDLIHRHVWGTQLTIIRVSDDGFDHYEEFEVKPETVGQFTGLVDKYGKKIFEGDIVVITTGLRDYELSYRNWRSEVKYWVHDCIAVFSPFTNFDIIETEVIGNIHDNGKIDA